MGDHQAGLLSWLLAGCNGYEFVNKYKYIYVHSLLEAVRNEYRVVSCRKMRSGCERCVDFHCAID
jgi:hypothetical protein